MFGPNAKDGSVGKISENPFARADLEHIHLMIDDDKVRKDIDDMNMRFYTNEQVHQIVDQLLLQFDEAAPGPEPAHLKNDIPQQSSPENKVTLTVSEAAELIGISKPSMYEVVRTGKVRSVKVGKKILISRQSLMDWLKKGENYGAEAC